MFLVQGTYIQEGIMIPTYCTKHAHHDKNENAVIVLEEKHHFINITKHKYLLHQHHPNLNSTMALPNITLSSGSSLEKYHNERYQIPSLSLLYLHQTLHLLPPVVHSRNTDLLRILLRPQPSLRQQQPTGVLWRKSIRNIKS